MYCVKCGVELVDSQRKCPLCQTPVYMPDLDLNSDTPYPPYKAEIEKLKPKGVLFIITVAHLVAFMVAFVCDLSGSLALEWCGYLFGALAVEYAVLFLPRWFARPHPAVFIPFAFFVLGCFLFCINYASGGGWFLTLALPLVAGGSFILSGAALLIYYLRRGYMYVIGGAFIAMAPYFLVAEWLSNVTFNGQSRLVWSPYPAVTAFGIGIMLIVISRVKPFRERVKKFFYI